MKYFLVLLFLINMLLSGCTSMPRSKDIRVANTEYTIYVIYRGWHTSIMLDANALALEVPLLAAELKNQKYARVGWGDGDYFTGKNKSFSSAAKALVASNYSAVQLLPYDYEPFAEVPAETRVPIFITQQGLHNLTRYIGDSMKLDEQGRLIRLPVFGAATGVFFWANNSYGVFRNCNTWTGNALRVAGVPGSNRLTAHGVFKQATYISRIQSEHGLVKTTY